jgi:hypothetical protein
MPYCDEEFGEVKLDSLKTLVDMLELAFRDQDTAETVKRELLKLKQWDREFSQYYAEFQRYVADIEQNTDVQMDALRNDLFNELKDSFQHTNLPDNIVDFVKMCSKWDSLIRASDAEKRSGR